MGVLWWGLMLGGWEWLLPDEREVAQPELNLPLPYHVNCVRLLHQLAVDDSQKDYCARLTRWREGQVQDRKGQI